MKYSVVFKPSAVKDLRKLPRSIQKRIKEKLEFYLSQNEPLDYAIKLTGNTKSGEYRFKAGDYRILFDINKDNLTILVIEHRREVYRKN